MADSNETSIGGDAVNQDKVGRDKITVEHSEDILAEILNYCRTNHTLISNLTVRLAGYQNALDNFRGRLDRHGRLFAAFGSAIVLLAAALIALYVLVL